MFYEFAVVGDNQMLKTGQQFSFHQLSKENNFINTHVDCCEVQIGHTVQYIGKNWNGPQQGSIGTVYAKRISTANVKLLNGVKWTIPYSMLAKYDGNDTNTIAV